MSYLKEPVDEFFASHQSLKVVFYQLFSTQLLVFILPISASTHLVMGASSHKPNKNPLIFCSPAKNPTFRSRKHFYIIYHTVSLNFFLVWTSQFTFMLSFKSLYLKCPHPLSPSPGNSMTRKLCIVRKYQYPLERRLLGEGERFFKSQNVLKQRVELT